MLSAQFGALIRRTRLAKGLRQSDLAAAARVSRTVLSKLEHGGSGPVQSDILDRIFAALGLQPQVAADAVPEERRRARLQAQARLAEQRYRHLQLAVRLAAEPRRAKALVRRARAVVDLWRERRTCSPLYIRRWSALLALPPRELARRMASLGDWQDALFQNTPWSWSWS
jgi:transcriptional regulator with XRE-family HTH domain